MFRLGRVNSEYMYMESVYCKDLLKYICTNIHTHAHALDTGCPHSNPLPPPHHYTCETNTGYTMREKCGLAGPDVTDTYLHIHSRYFLASTHTPASRAGKGRCQQATGQ